MRERELQLELERIEEMERAKEREERLLLRSMTDAQRCAYLATKEAAGMDGAHGLSRCHLFFPPPHNRHCFWAFTLCNRIYNVFPDFL